MDEITQTTHAMNAATPPQTIEIEALVDTIKGADLIYADPPWDYGRIASSNGFGGSCRKHYPRMTTEALKRMPIKDFVATDCVCLLWATGKHMPDALEILRSWGFQYRSVFQTWVKTNRRGTPKMALGLYSRSSTEYLLLGIRGKIKPLLSDARDVSGIIMEETTRHSRKPETARERIDRRFSPCTKRVELFSRATSLDYPWSGWGNEFGNERGSNELGSNERGSNELESAL